MRDLMHLGLWIALWLPAAMGWAQSTWFGPTSIDDAASRPHVSLVFSSPDEVSPLSYFGHTFLVFHREELPELDAPVVEFLGQTAGIDGWAVQALFSSVPGRYQLQRFLYKSREYDLENRDLWIYTLKLTEAERAVLVERLRSRMPQVHPYQFTVENCGAYIEALLPFIDEPQSLYSLPIKTIQNPQVQSRIASVHVQLSQRSQGRLSQDPADWLRFRYAREADRGKRQELFKALKTLPELKPQVRTDDPAGFSGRRRLGLQVHSTRRAHVLLSPYAHDFATPATEVVPGSVLRILAADIEIGSRMIALDSLELFHLEAMTADDDWTDGMVRHLEFAYHQRLDLNDKPGWLLRWGTGYAWQPVSGLLLGAKGFVDLDILHQPRPGWQLDTGGILYAEYALSRTTRAAFLYRQSILPRFDRWSRQRASLGHSFMKGMVLEVAGDGKEWQLGLMQHF